MILPLENNLNFIHVLFRLIHLIIHDDKDEEEEEYVRIVAGGVL